MAESPWVRVHETLGAEATAAPPVGGGARPMFRPRAIGQALAAPRPCRRRKPQYPMIATSSSNTPSPICIPWVSPGG